MKRWLRDRKERKRWLIAAELCRARTEFHRSRGRGHYRPPCAYCEWITDFVLDLEAQA